ncbi:MAG: transporter [Kiritimatiellae bacterium]|nr:transporter [Kiritimatiellia bacterium]
MKERVKVGLLAAGLMATAAVSFAARPLIIDDADPLDTGNGKIEAGFWHEKNGGCKNWDWPIGLGCGLVPGLEVNLGLGGTLQQMAEIDENGAECIKSENGLGDLTLNAKWQFLEESKWIPRQAIVPAVKFPTANKDTGLGSGKIDYDLTWIASKSFTDKAGGHLNLGYSFIGAPADEDVGDIIHYGAALDYRLIDPLQWVGEIYAEKELMSGTDHIIMFNTGLRWFPLDGLMIDVAAGSHISSAGPDLTTAAGLTWEFGIWKRKDK